MTWLVVGGNGQLGKALSLILAERGIEYRAWGSDDLDIRSAKRCNQKILELSPSIIVNTAAWTDVDGAESDPNGAYAVNADGALNLAAAAKSIGAIFIHISTDYVFSGVSHRPYAETDLRTPVSVYGTTKAAGEVSVLEKYSERSYVFRTAWLYSQWGKNFAKTMTKLALVGNGEVKVVDDQVGQPTYALDLANQIVDTVLAGLPYSIYHGTNSGQASWFDFAEEIFKLCGPDVLVERLVRADSSNFLRPAKRPSYSVLDHDAWQSIGAAGLIVPPMRDWRRALHQAMPAIIFEVKAEG